MKASPVEKAYFAVETLYPALSVGIG
jgi:hypothetical protein